MTRLIEFFTNNAIATAITIIVGFGSIIGCLFRKKVRENIIKTLSLSKYILYLLPHFLFVAYDIFFKKNKKNVLCDNNENKEILLKIEQSIKACDDWTAEVTDREIFDKLGFGNKLNNLCSYGEIDPNVLVISYKDLNNIKKLYEIK